MTPTQQQIKQAQEAGNDAYNGAVVNACKPWICYEAYREAYDATLAALTDPISGVDWGKVKAELNAERAAMIERETAERRCTCGAGYLTIPRNHDARCALRQAAQEAGVKAEWTPAPNTAEMIRIVQDAMRNDPPIEY